MVAQQMLLQCNVVVNAVPVNAVQLPDLSAFASLEKLDLSINQLRSTAPLATLQSPNLQELYLTSNKFSTIEVKHRPWP